MNAIRILSENVASQIAAGEVIERPASVVRELLDNSIDAGADRISVHIEKGGKGLVRVSDNGVGMNRDDLLLCIERHATSKIYQALDLYSIRTLGFRGEALPSIASVSKMEITSRPADHLVGYRLRINGGKLKSIDETGSPPGTTVEIRDLFFNIPARRKFLRTVRTETDQIVETISRLALPHARIRISLSESGKTLLNLPASEKELNRLTAVLGRHCVSSMIEALDESSHFRIRAYIAPPGQTRSRGDHILIYVNSRNIKDRALSRAVMEGYGQRLMKGRYPEIVVFIEIDPSQVDVNVHPTKQEVKFHQLHLLSRSLTAVIDGALGKHFRAVSHMGTLGDTTPESAGVKGMSLSEPETVYGGELFKDPAPAIGERKEEPLVREKVHILGQLKGTYILCQAPDGLLIFDQHAAHERVVYETMKKSIQNARIERQAFLIPYKMDVSLKEGRVLREKRDELSLLGLEIEHFGGNTFLLRSVPTILVDVKWEEFIREITPLVEQGGDLTDHSVLDGMLTLMACHGAIRAGRTLSMGEMSLLLKQLEEMDLPSHCPHGRPIFIKFDNHDLEKMFRRVV
ncbi:MAG: DNA mismatch repair endonuclease MutL [Pseudomonadota bacterium]